MEMGNVFLIKNLRALMLLILSILLITSHIFAFEAKVYFENTITNNYKFSSDLDNSNFYDPIGYNTIYKNKSLVVERVTVKNVGNVPVKGINPVVDGYKIRNYESFRRIAGINSNKLINALRIYNHLKDNIVHATTSTKENINPFFTYDSFGPSSTLGWVK